MAEKLPQRIDKPWGFEVLFAHTPKYSGKMIFVKKGCRLSFHYHAIKDESMYVYQGSAEVEIEGSDGKFKKEVASAGACFRIPTGAKHRMKALEDTTLFEVSTPELDDINRLADDYGRAGEKNG